jgi:hypothetical protein
MVERHQGQKIEIEDEMSFREYPDWASFEGYLRYF